MSNDAAIWEQGNFSNLHVFQMAKFFSPTSDNVILTLISMILSYLIFYVSIYKHLPSCHKVDILRCFALKIEFVVLNYKLFIQKVMGQHWRSSLKVQDSQLMSHVMSLYSYTKPSLLFFNYVSLLQENPLVIECFDFNSDGNHVFIGYVESICTYIGASSQEFISDPHPGKFNVQFLVSFLQSLGFHFFPFLY